MQSKEFFFSMNRTFDDLTQDMAFKHHVQQIFRQKTANFKSQQILEIELTNRCSIGCFYCGAATEKSTVFLDLDTVCSAIINFVESRESRSLIPHVSFTGGDPLEYPYLNELMAFLKKRNVSFSMKLNPSTLSESFHRMIEGSRCESVKLTFMGLDSQGTYRKKDTLDLLGRATRRFLKDGIPVVWHFSLGEFNREDLLNSLYFVVENNASAISVGRLARVGRLNEDNYPLDITPESFRQFLHQMLLFYYNHKRYGFNLMFKEKLWVPFLIEEGILPEDFLKEPEIRLGCDARERLTVLTYAGDLLGCGLLPEPVLSRTVDADFTEVLRSVHPPEPFLEGDPCLSCRYVNLCRGCRGVSRGTSRKADPQCWLAKTAS